MSGVWTISTKPMFDSSLALFPGGGGGGCSILLHDARLHFTRSASKSVGFVKMEIFQVVRGFDLRNPKREFLQYTLSLLRSWPEFKCHEGKVNW